MKFIQNSAILIGALVTCGASTLALGSADLQLSGQYNVRVMTECGTYFPGITVGTNVRVDALEAQLILAPEQGARAVVYNIGTTVENGPVSGGDFYHTNQYLNQGRAFNSSDENTKLGDNFGPGTTIRRLREALSISFADGSKQCILFDSKR